MPFVRVIFSLRKNCVLGTYRTEQFLMAFKSLYARRRLGWWEHTRMCWGYMYMLGVRTHVIVYLCVHEYIAYAYVYMCVYIPTYTYMYLGICTCV